MADVRQAEQAFVEIARAGEVAEDFLPLSGQSVDEVIEVFQCLPAGRATPYAVHPPPATTFLLQPADGPPPAFTKAQHILGNSAVAVGPGFAGTPETPPRVRYLLLGLEDVHVVRDIRFGALAPQITAVSGIPADRVHISVQRDPFHSLSIQGQTVTKCLSYRDRAFIRAPLVYTLYFDCRSLGISTCSRLVTKLAFNLQELLHLIDFEVLEGFLVQVFGGEDLGDGTLEFRDRDSIVVKVARPDGLHGEAETRSDNTHTTEGPGEDGSPRSRSRSPPGSLRRLLPVEGESSAADTVGSDSLAGAVRGKTCAVDSGSRNSMWNVGVSVHHARPSCRPEDTSADCGPVAVLGVEVGPVPCRRPLPTICRNSVEVHRRPHCQDREPLRTTLELCDPVDRFCHMLRVLAFLDKPPRTGQSLTDECIPTHSPRVVCLSELVGPTTFDLTRTQVPIGKTLGDLQDILVFDFGNSWHKALPGFDVLHPSTVAAVRDCELAQQQGCRPDGLCVYTDGSYDGTVSGWSIVCVACCGDRPVDVCWMHGRVEVDAAHPRWLGAAAHGAQEAELTAVAVALLWGLSLRGSLHFTLGSDSLVTVNRASGLWHIGASNKLAHTCRALAQALEAFGYKPWTSLHHVRAHVGQAWNELADVLAKQAVGPHVRECGHPDISSWVRDGSIGHLWLLISAHLFPSVWPAFEGGSLTTSPDFVCTALPSHAYFGRPTGGGPDRPGAVWYQLKVVTMNVQTLEGGGIHDQEGRAAFLRSQMHDMGVHVVAVQEARTPKSATILSESYVRLCSGRTQTGQYGVELWFLRAKEGERFTFRADELTVVYFDPRILAVRVEAMGFRGVVVCVHAPTSADPGREAWWCTLADILASVNSRGQLLLIGDWNAKFNVETHSRVGPLQCGDVDDVPAGARRTLEAHDLWLPCTFPHLHTGPSETWFSPGHAKASRLDYIAIPCSWVVDQCASRTLPEIDLGHTSLDHVAVFLEVWFPARKHAQGWRRQAVHFDRQAMATAEGQAALREICDTVPTVEWSVDASYHYHVVQTHLQQGLERAFPAKKRKVAQSYLSDATWVLKDYSCDFECLVMSGILEIIILQEICDFSAGSICVLFVFFL